MLGKTLAIFAFTCASSLSFAQVSIPKFATVSPGVYRGGFPGPRGLEELRALGVKTIIDLEGGDVAVGGIKGFAASVVDKGETQVQIAAEQLAWEASGSGAGDHTFVHLPLSTLRPFDADEMKSVEKALAVLQDPKQQPVFIHCSHGKDRTGLVIALLRIKSEGWSKQAAIQEMESFGHKKMRSIDDALEALVTAPNDSAPGDQH